MVALRNIARPVVLRRDIASSVHFGSRMRSQLTMASANDTFLSSLEIYFDEVSSFLSTLGGGRMDFANEAYTEYVLERLGYCISSLAIVLDYLHPTEELTEDEEESIALYQQQLSELLQCIRQISVQWQSHFDQLQINNGVQRDTSFRLSTVSSGGPGQPKFLIRKEQLEYLSSMSFNWTYIAKILGVSRMTIYRRRVEFNLLIDPSRNVTDAELNSAVHTLRCEHPEIGESMVWGQLRAAGVQVTRERVRFALRRLDPLNSALRWRGTLAKRRPYSVPGPNSLWHIGK